MYLARKGRFMTALQANAESGSECVTCYWLSILGTDTNWNAAFTAVLQDQTYGLLWLVTTNFALLDYWNITVLAPGWKHFRVYVLKTFRKFWFARCLNFSL